MSQLVSQFSYSVEEDTHFPQLPSFNKSLTSEGAITHSFLGPLVSHLDIHEFKGPSNILSLNRCQGLLPLMTASVVLSICNLVIAFSV